MRGGVGARGKRFKDIKLRLNGEMNERSFKSNTNSVSKCDERRRPAGYGEPEVAEGRGRGRYVVDVNLLDK